MNGIERNRRQLGSWLCGAAALWLCASAMTYAAEPAGSPAAPQSKNSRSIDYEKLPLQELTRKANGSDIKAKFELGSRLNYGRGVPKNVKQGLRWLLDAASLGHRDAQRLLALKFYHGYDVAINHEEALRWAQRLAEGGDAAGQMMLAAMFANGEGGPRNLVHAYAWYDIAAATAQQKGEAGDPEAQATAAAAAEQRDKIGALLLPAEEQAAQNYASDWWIKKTAKPSRAKTRR